MIMHRSNALALALASLLAAPAPAAPPSSSATPVGRTAESIDFAALGRSFVKANCPDGADHTTCPWETILAARYARLTVGVYDVYFPVQKLKVKERAKELNEGVLGLLDMQRYWIQWLLGSESETAKAGLADLELVRDWYESLKTSQVSKFDPEEDGTFFEQMKCKDEVLAAAGRLDALLHDRETMGLAPDPGRQARILLAPDRRLFMELVGYAGLVDDDQRKAYWIDGVDQWTHIWVDWVNVLAHEYAPWGGFDPDFSRGETMTVHDQTGLVEHIVQRSTIALVRNCLVGREPGHVEDAISLNLAIEVCGEVNTIDSAGVRGTSGATTAPYSRFVPGGNSAGGVLPAISAAPFDALVENQWRVGGGQDHFIDNLKKGQKDGAKRAAKDRSNPLSKDKHAHFTLASDASAEKYVLSAPFMGSIAMKKEYPPFEFLVDYKEFFRAYKTAFFHWLRMKGVENDEDLSREKYRALLHGLSGLESHEGVDALVLSIYGLPLSGPSGEEDSLEWRFLRWLPKGK